MFFIRRATTRPQTNLSSTQTRNHRLTQTPRQAQHDASARLHQLCHTMISSKTGQSGTGGSTGRYRPLTSGTQPALSPLHRPPWIKAITSKPSTFTSKITPIPAKLRPTSSTTSVTATTSSTNPVSPPSPGAALLCSNQTTSRPARTYATLSSKKVPPPLRSSTGSSSSPPCRSISTKTSTVPPSGSYSLPCSYCACSDLNAPPPC